MTGPVIVWFRRDLRLADNAALSVAAARGEAVIPLYIWSPGEEAPWAPASASRVWLHHSLAALQSQLEQRGSRLLLRTGDALSVLRSVTAAAGAGHVYCNRLYEPVLVRRDEMLAEALAEDGIRFECHGGHLLREPGEILGRLGAPLKVFTPFWKRLRGLPPPPEPVPVPARLPAPFRWPDSRPLAALGLEPGKHWARDVASAWMPGEAGAQSALERFTTGHLENYDSTRDFPSLEGVSRLSPFLHFGEISPAQAWHAVLQAQARGGRLSPTTGAEAFLRQLGWREFAHHMLHYFPETPDAPLQARFARFRWQDDAAMLLAWQRGRTGYPIVDAGMRQLWQTGWMHNRVRMIAGSFLVKDLLVDWREGARWFWDTLVDADLANNTLGWQWVAGCGADAAPFFRIFNPVTQGERFDAGGDYVRRWIPELSRLPGRLVHKPWEASPAELVAAGVRLGEDYPLPVIDHRMARQRALETYATIHGDGD